MSSAHLICPHCSREFARREHLTRHILTHSNEKPYSCARCGKSYARRDVYQKHLRVHGQPNSPSSTRKKALVACDTCRERKVKCHVSERPCPRCKSAGIVCTFRKVHASGTNFSPPETPDYSPPSADVIANYGSLDGEIDDRLIPRDAMLATSNIEPTATFQEVQPSSIGNPGGADFMPWNETEPLDVNTFTVGDLSLPEFYGDVSQNPIFQNEFFGDIAAVYGSNPSDFDLSIFTEPFGIQEDITDFGERQQERLATAYAKVNDFSTLPCLSRPASPGSVMMHERYLQELGSMEPLTYDTLVIDIFIGLFQVHVAPTFPCFQQFQISSSTPEELYLAMAAVGGLYCKTLKSDIVAKWLHHISRRKLLTEVFCKAECPRSRKLTILQTYILTELFALLSGDKRSVSLSDIYHAQVIQAVRTLNSGPSETSVCESKLQQVLDAVNMLECYRVVLLQRSAMLYPFSLLGEISTSSLQPTRDSDSPNQNSILFSLRSIASNNGSLVRIDSSVFSAQSLCALSLLVSHGRHLPGALSKYAKSSNGERDISGRGWRQETLELALQKWLASHTSPPLPGTLMLFHTVYLSIYSNFAGIERSARSVLDQATSPSQKSDHSDAYPGRPPTASVRFSPTEPCFTSEEDMLKSKWHANRILDIAKDTMQGNDNQPRERVHLAREVGREENSEVVHYSHSVYHASMVLWWLHTFHFSKLDTDTKHTRLAAKSLQRGAELLSRSNSQVATVFQQTMRALLLQLHT